MSSSEDGSRNPDPEDADGLDGNGEQRPCLSAMDDDVAYLPDASTRFTPEWWAKVVERAIQHRRILEELKGRPRELD